MIDLAFVQSRATEFRASNPRARAVDVAAGLGVPEGVLAASEPGAIRLAPRWEDLLRGLEAVGEGMALTRNPAAVHERRGVYSGVRMEAGGVMGGVYGPDIDLRVFPGRWAFAVAFASPTRAGPRPTLQVFGPDGEAVHKVWATDATDLAAWDALVSRLAVSSELPEIEEPTAMPAATPDVDGLADDWAAMTDTHQFFGLLRRRKLRRDQAFEAVRGRFADELPLGAGETALSSIAVRGHELLVFVGNRGCIQIHHGPIHRVTRAGPWLNVLDERFNLHLDEGRVRSLWRVRKPTADGPVTSLEWLDAGGEVALQVFGARTEGQGEPASWTACLAGLSGV